eukprot:4166840-Prymnesium_polylepis.1
MAYISNAKSEDGFHIFGQGRWTLPPAPSSRPDSHALSLGPSPPSMTTCAAPVLSAATAPTRCGSSRPAPTRTA